MILTGLIRNFGNYTDEQLEKMKSDLKIQMSLPKLKVCASYYATKAQRDPYIEELRFLDRFVEKAVSTPSAVAPKELLTNDAFVAQTYADLIEKRRELYPNAQKPCSLEEAFGIMGAYLARTGKTVVQPHEAYAIEPLRALPGMTQAPNLLSPENVGCGLRRSFRKKLPYESTDIVALLAPAKGLTSAEEALAFNSFFSNDSCTSEIKAIHSIGECGILYEALRMSAGIQIDLSVLSVAGEDVELSSLVTDHVNHYLVRIANTSYLTLAKNAKGMKFSLLPLAGVSDPYSITLLEGQQPLLSWSAEFVRSLYRFTPVTMHMEDESAKDTAPILQAQHTVGSCAYLTDAPICMGNTISQYGNTIYTTAFCSPDNSFFRNALDTVLSTVIITCASGIPFTDQRLAVGLGLPSTLNTDQTASTAMSTILGLYRAEAELAIPLAFGKISIDSTLSNPELTVFALSKGVALPDHLSEVNHRLYCVMPEYGENGIPNFEQLRAFLDWLTDLSQKGILKSARVIARKTVRAALAEMNSDAVVGILNDATERDETVLSLAILLETTEEINATFVGYTAEKPQAEEETTEPAEIMLPETECLIWSSKASVVIYALENDRDAHTLALRLAQKGARVQVLTPNDEWQKLASALLQSQTLILCQGVQLAKRPEVAFAKETLERAGGLLLRLGATQSNEKDDQILSVRALSEQMIDQICKNTNN